MTTRILIRHFFTAFTPPSTPCFIDGNKRTGFIVSVLFLELNGYHFTATEADATLKTLALAAGEMTEGAYAEWLGANSEPAKSSLPN